jgi:hypothetical protein
MHRDDVLITRYRGIAAAPQVPRLGVQPMRLPAFGDSSTSAVQTLFSCVMTMTR